MSRTIRLDVHAHLVPVIEERLSSLDGVHFDAARTEMMVDGHRVAVKPLFRAGNLLQWMDDNRVEQAWISIPPPLYRQHLRGEESRLWAQYVNDGLKRIADGSNGRLSALFHLPTEDPAVACALAELSCGQGHARFAMACGTGDERGLSDAAFEPLWRVLDDAGAFVFFHPGDCADGRLKSFYLGNLVGNPYESTVAIAHLVLGGVLDRFANMTVCFAHGGGFAPMAAGRLQRGFDTERPGVDKRGMAPATALRRLHVDCICHDETALQLAEETFGADKVLFGSDWPFPMGMIEPGVQMRGYEDERLDRLFDHNPKRFLAGLSGRRKETR